MKIYVSLSRKSKKGKSGNPRSMFLSAFMKTIGADPSVVDSFVGKDKEEFLKKVDALKHKLAEKMPNVG